MGARVLIGALVIIAVAVLTFTNVLPSISSPNYWWVVLGFVVVAVLAKVYWRATTGSWRNPRS